MWALSWSGPDHEHPRNRRCRLNRPQTSDVVVALATSPAYTTWHPNRRIVRYITEAIQHRWPSCRPYGGVYDSVTRIQLHITITVEEFAWMFTPPELSISAT
jgi:hypothetical protein